MQIDWVIEPIPIFEFPHIFDLLGGIQNKSQVVALLGLFQIRQGANHAYIIQRG